MSAKEGLLSAGGDQKRTGRRAAFLLLFAAAFCLVLVAGYSLTGSHKSERTELEERHRDRDSDRKHGDEQRKKDALKRVSSVQLVSDIKKVLLDVESTLQHSRMRRYTRDKPNTIVFTYFRQPRIDMF
jgi:hypothetical protein